MSPKHQFGALGSALPAVKQMRSLKSPEYINQPNWICRRLLKHLIPLDFSLALAKAGKSIAAKIAMMAITTSNSMRVKAPFESGRCMQGTAGIVRARADPPP
jgi:hypothetical protein